MLFWVLAALAVVGALAIVWVLYLLVRRWLLQRGAGRGWHTKDSPGPPTASDGQDQFVAFTALMHWP
jgi:hypothetical protein